MTKISIVTITYNAADVLRVTLDSVLRQHHPCLEHIIVDGASTDGTVDIANAYKTRSAAEVPEHEVSVVSEPDKGLYDAMNKGLRRATGDYVCFLNAGDWLPADNTLDLVVEMAAKTTGMKPAVIYGDTDLVDKDGHFIGHRRLSPPEKLTWRSFKQGMLVCHQAFYARMDLARQVEYDTRYRFSADVDWCIRVMKLAEKEKAPLCRIDAVLVNYLHEGQTTKNHKKSLRERFDVMRRHYGLVTTIALHCWFVVRALLKR